MESISAYFAANPAAFTLLTDFCRYHDSVFHLKEIY